MIPVRSKADLRAKFNAKLQEILEQNPEMVMLKDLDDFAFKIYDNLKDFN